MFEEDADGIPHETYRRLYYAFTADGRSVAEHLVLAGSFARTGTVTLVAQGSGTPVGASVTYDAATRVATLERTPDLAASTTYTATVFTTAAPGTSTVRYVSDLSWTSATNGWGPVERDRSNGETGAADGATIRLNGVTYAKA